MCSESKEPVYITKNGYGDMVIMAWKPMKKRCQQAGCCRAAGGNRAEQDAHSALQELRAQQGWLKQPLHRQTWMRSCLLALSLENPASFANEAKCHQMPYLYEQCREAFFQGLIKLSNLLI